MKKKAFAFFYTAFILIALIRAEFRTLPLLESSLAFHGLIPPVQADPIVGTLSLLSERHSQFVDLADSGRRSVVEEAAENFRPLVAKWKISDVNNRLFPDLRNSTAVDESGFYVADDSGYLRAYAWSGELRWQFFSDFRGGFTAAPLTDEDTIYLGDSAGWIYAIGKVDGKLRWFLKAGNAVRSSPILQQGTLYFTVLGQENDGFLLAIDAKTGRWIWNTEFLGSIPSSPSFDEKLKFLFVTTAHGDLKAFSLMGQSIWDFHARTPLRCAPVISDGRIFISGSEGKAFAVLAASGVVAWEVDLKVALGCPALHADRLLWVGEGVHFLVDARNASVVARKGGIPSIPRIVSYRKSTVGIYSCEKEVLCIENLASGDLLQSIRHGDAIVGSASFLKEQLFLSTEERHGLIGFGP